MSLHQTYNTKIVPSLQKQFGYKSIMAVPRVRQVVLNIGAGKSISDAKYLETMEGTLRRITGQQPVKTKAKKSIASFKIRQGMVVGLRVTLRGARMWDFLDKLVNVTLPRVRDFRGLSRKGFDRQGNYSLGLREHIVFPEIGSDEVERLHGVQITVSTTATKPAEGIALLEQLGFPFRNDTK